MVDIAAAGSVTLADDLTLHRMGYGAMQLSGPHIFGPPQDRDEAVAVLREAVDAGVNHIDTSDYYGPYVTNEIIREALHPYPEELHLVTKIGALRGDDGSWNPAFSRDQIVQAVHDNLDHLGLEALDVANFRVMDGQGFDDVAEAYGVMVELQQQGLIRHLGISTVDLDGVKAAHAAAPVVCVQNHYNVAHRDDDPIVDYCEEQGLAFVPYFPLGGFSPLQSQTLDAVADRLGATPMQVSLAWLLHRSPQILLIPGTSSRAHLRENLAAVDVELPDDVLEELDSV